MEFSLSQPLGIAAAMEQLMSEYEDRFPEVFCSITTDNGNEFAAFSVFEALGREIFQAKKQGKFCIGKQGRSKTICICKQCNRFTSCTSLVGDTAPNPP